MTLCIGILSFGLKERLETSGKKFQGTQIYGLETGRLDWLVNQFSVI